MYTSNEETLYTDSLLHVRGMNLRETMKEKCVVMLILQEVGIDKEKLQKDGIEVLDQTDCLEEKQFTGLDNIPAGGILTSAVDHTVCDLYFR